MLFCKGRGCRYRKSCSRYVLGRAAKVVDVSAEWIDHCLHTSKFERQQPPQDERPKYIRIGNG